MKRMGICEVVAHATPVVGAAGNRERERRRLMSRARRGLGRLVTGAALVVLAGVAACGSKGGRDEYSNAADSGAVAPAMRLDTSLTRSYPDSTTGGPDRTG